MWYIFIYLHGYLKSSNFNESEFFHKSKQAVIILSYKISINNSLNWLEKMQFY